MPRPILKIIGLIGGALILAIVFYSNIQYLKRSRRDKRPRLTEEKSAKTRVETINLIKDSWKKECCVCPREFDDDPNVQQIRVKYPDIKTDYKERENAQGDIVFPICPVKTRLWGTCKNTTCECKSDN